MNDSEQITQIAAYLDEAMSPEERQAFEERVSNDPALAREVRTMKALRDDSRMYFRQKALSQQIAKQNETSQTRPLWRQRTFQISLAIAAGIAFFLLIRPILFVEQTQDHEALFAQYFEAYDESGLMTERGDTSDIDLWKEAGNAYQQGDYAAAATSFMTIIQEDSTFIPARFYLANSLLAARAIEEAIPHLTFIVERDDFLYGRQSRWLLALAYVHTQASEQAIPILEELQRSNDALGRQAKKLLRAIPQ